jgi:lysophospholipid acyltransferase (LPLAT)-like uncharacterized protein
MFLSFWHSKIVICGIITKNSARNFNSATVPTVSHHLNVSVIKALITHLDFDVIEKVMANIIVGHYTTN